MNKHHSQSAVRSPDESKHEERIDQILAKMSLHEMVKLLSGEDFWSVAALLDHGIGKLRVTDGPNGARGSGSSFQEGGENITSASFPVGIALGASWDPDLINQIAQAIAQETKSKGAQVCLAPTVNIHRSVTNGRNFECFSEDPELSADLTVAYIKGLQDEGIAPSIKHFAGNESEIERTTINSEIDERSLREIYLRPFEAAVKEADAWVIMSSYNKLNGTYTAENDWLLTDVLRGEWGFDGIVMSDWFGSRTTAATINAGLDLEMPGPTRDRGEKLITAIEAGEVSKGTIRGLARNMLRLMARVGVLDDMPEYKEVTDDRPEHRALIRRAGAECAVLLKNEAILPLAEPKGKIAVIGPNAKVARIMGGGSSQLNPHYRISPWDGLVDRLGEEKLAYAPGCQNHRWEPVISGEIKVEFFAKGDLGGEVVSTKELHVSVDYLFPEPVEGKIGRNNFSCRASMTYTATESGLHSFGLHSAGRSRLKIDGYTVVDIWDEWEKGRTFFEEGCDERTNLFELEAGKSYELEMEFQTVPAASLVNPAFRFGVSRPFGDTAIKEAAEIAKNCETVLLFVGRSGEWDTEGSDLENIKLPGRQDELVKEVVAVNPNTVVVLQTGGPVEMPWLESVPAVLQAWYPGQEVGNAVADILFGDIEPAGRLPQSFPRRWSDNPTQSDDPKVYPGTNGIVRYEEGLFIGYRHYDATGIVPLFPFGHGLGFTNFQISKIEAVESESFVDALVTVKNIGPRQGTTVVQLYVSDQNAKVIRPKKELKGFQKITVPAGEEKTISIQLTSRDFAFFDVEQSLWQVASGEFILSAGFSAENLQAFTTVTRKAEEFAK